MQNLIGLTGDKIPILCIQEHFLLRNSLRKLTSFFKQSSVLAKPAYKGIEQMQGRAKGGLAMIVPKNMRKNAKIIKCESWRLQPIIFNLQNKKYLIVNVYFPTDNKTLNGDCLELDDCLSALSTIIQTTEFHLLHIAGDLNFESTRNTSHVRKVKGFFEEHNLGSLWTEFEVDFTHCYENENQSFVTTIDHFVMFERSKQVCKEAGVIHHPENQSDHEPIYSIIDCPKVDTEPQKEETDCTPKFDWKNATEDQKLEFNDILFRKLMMLNIPDCVEGCTNLKCSEKSHIHDIDNYVKEVLHEIMEAGDCSIPKRKPKVIDSKNKNTPGWNSFVKPFQDNAHFWHAIWTSCGRPINVEVHRIMKRTRNIFHYQVRKCRRVEDYIRNKNIIENCIEGDADLFAEIKKQRKNAADDDVTIDGVAGKDIPGKFANVYSELFNRETDDAEVNKVKVAIEDEIDEDSWNEINKVNSSSIKEALKRIKPDKSDPICNFSSDFLKNSPEVLIYHLEKMIKAFLVHGHVSEVLLLATLVPIVKDKLGDLCSSANYRSIAISSLILKLLDWIVINLYGHLLKCDDFQFGFQEQSSTSLCSWVVYETIDMYLRKGSKVYGVLMD